MWLRVATQLLQSAKRSLRFSSASNAPFTLHTLVFPRPRSANLSTSPALCYEFLKTEKRGEKQNVAVIRLNRPRALNALCDGLMAELGEALREYDADEGVGAMVITGSEKAFAAGQI